MLRFSVTRIPVQVRPTFWITIILLGLQNGLGGRGLAAWTVAVFIAVLLHEMGHAWSARLAGADSIDVQLYFLGGVTVWSAPDPIPPQRRLGVAAAGSGIGIVAGLIAWIPMLALDLPSDLHVFIRSFVFAALVWGVLNWVPIRSLDGGVMVSSFLEWVFPRRGKLLAESILFGFGVVAVAASLAFGQLLLALIVGFFGLSGAGVMIEELRSWRDDRRLADDWSRLDDLHRTGSFEEAAVLAERISADATSATQRNKAHEEAVRNWYLAGLLDRAVQASDAWEDADHFASWVAVQAYLDAGRALDVQRLATAGVVTEPVLAGPLAVVDVMMDNQRRLNELINRFPDALASYLPMKVSDRIGPLDPHSRRQIVRLFDRLPTIPLVQRIGALLEAGLADEALALIEAEPPTPDLQALRAQALALLGLDDQAERILLELADAQPTVTAQVVAMRIGRLDLAERLGERLIAGGGPGLHVVLYNHACVASLTGRRSQAVERTRRAIDEGFGVVRSLNFDPDIAEIREDPAFPRLRSAAWEAQQLAIEQPAPG